MERNRKGIVEGQGRGHERTVKVKIRMWNIKIRRQKIELKLQKVKIERKKIKKMQKIEILR